MALEELSAISENTSAIPETELEGPRAFTEDELESFSSDPISMEQQNDFNLLNGFMRDVLSFAGSATSHLSPAVRLNQFTVDKTPHTRFGNGMNAFMSGFAEPVYNALTSGLAGTLQTARRYNPSSVIYDLINGERIGGDDEMTGFEQMLFDTGKELDGQLEKLFPENPEYRGEFLSSMIPNMVGTLTGQLSLAGGMTGAGAATKTVTNMTAAATAISFSGAEFEQAYEATGDANTATQAFMANLPINAIGTKLQMATFLDRYNKVTGGGVTKHLMKGIKDRYTSATARPISATFAGGFEEGVTEIAQEFATNLSAKALYDEGRGMLEGLKEVGAPAFVLGAVLNGYSIGTQLRRRNESLDVHSEAVIDLTEKYISDERKKLVEPKRGGVPFDPDSDADIENTGRKPVPETTENKNTQPALVFDSSGFLGKAKKKTSKLFNEWIKPQGNYPDAVYDRIMDKGNQRAADLWDMTVRTRELESAVKKDFDIDGDIYDPSIFPTGTMESINNALGGDEKALNGLPENTYKAITRMRDHIDRMSKDLMDQGLLAEELEAKIKSNLGSYIHRSFRLFGGDKQRQNWIDNVPEDVVNNAKRFIREMYSDRNVELSESMLQTRIDDILYDQEMPLYFISQIKDRKKDLHTISISSDVLKQRQNIPEPIRALMGEEINPFSNYIKTVSKLSETVHESKFFIDLSEKMTRGNNKIFSKSRNQELGHTHKVSPNIQGIDFSNVHIYTTPEIANQLEESYKVEKHGGFFKAYMSLNAATKYAKTTLNLTTHGRNLIGGGLMALNAGHLPGSGYYRGALKTMRDAFMTDIKRGGIGLSEESEAYIRKLKSLGLMDKDVRSGELADILKDIEINENAFLGDSFDHMKKQGNGVYKNAKKGIDFMTKLYQAEDNLIRIAFFEAELARYREADPNISEEYVARIVQDTYQDYSQVGKAAKLVRRFPLVGPFIAFPHEVIRTSVNNAMQAKRELSSDNPKIKEIGAQRMSGMVAAGVGTTIMSMLTRYMFGISEKEDEDARRFDAPWNARAEKLYIGKNEDGNLQSISLSYIDPYAIIKEPVLELLFRDRHDSFSDKMTSALGGLFEPLLNEEILSQKLREIGSNKKKVGGRVYNPQDGLGDRYGDIFAHLWDGFEPGSITSARNLIDSIDETEKTEWEKERDPSEELLALFGLRVVTTDPKRAIKFDTMDFRTNITNIRQITADIEAEDILSPTNRPLIERSISQETAVIKDMSEKIRAAYRLGLDRSELLKSVKEAGMSESQFEELEAGLFLPRTEQEMFRLKFEQEMRSLR